MQENDLTEVDPTVYESSETFYPCCVRVIRNPYDSEEALLDWYLEGHYHDCPYPSEDILEFHEGVSVTVLKSSGKICTMWKRGNSDKEKVNQGDGKIPSVDIRIYDTETVYKHQIVDVWYPISSQGDCKLDWYNIGEERVTVFPGYQKCETIVGATVEVWSNSFTGQSSVGWYRE